MFNFTAAPIGWMDFVLILLLDFFIAGGAGWVLISKF